LIDAEIDAKKAASAAFFVWHCRRCRNRSMLNHLGWIFARQVDVRHAAIAFTLQCAASFAEFPLWSYCMIKTTVTIFLSAMLFGGFGNAAADTHDSALLAPERSSGYIAKQGWTAKKFMVVAANPLAVDAGYQMLKAGGSAIDAAIATQMVLTLVEPQSSGIGGGAFLLYFDGKAVKAFDGRETAPAAATEALFLHEDGKPMPFFDAVVGGRSVGVPGVLRMLELAHRQHGKLPWPDLFAPAIRLANNGFAVSPRLAMLLQDEPYLKKDPAAAAYFYDGNGHPRPVGYLLKNPALAKTLKNIADNGADAFYKGQIARDIADKVAHHPTNPGSLNIADLADYRAKVREPVCSDYRVWTVCGMPPPSSGGIAVAQMLGILESRNMRALAPTTDGLNAEAVHLFAEAGRLAYADRNRYIADTDFVPLPGNSFAPLLDKQYLAQRAALIGEQSMKHAQAGMPQNWQVAWGNDASPELPSTSHMSIVDEKGNAIAMTTTIENAFGSRQMVDGFMLNNELTDFSAIAVDNNGPVANRVQPGKRPRSSMAPTFVFDKRTNKLIMAIGSPGGSSIINYVTKVLIGTLDWGLDMQKAIDLPNIGSRNGPTELEQGRVSSALVDALKARGHEVLLDEQTSGLHGFMRVRDKGIWFGGADPRREGIAKGD
jgi:gamma-glutamyltranspeptidase/glutathione hydrolase